MNFIRAGGEGPARCFYLLAVSSPLLGMRNHTNTMKTHTRLFRGSQSRVLAAIIPFGVAAALWATPGAARAGLIINPTGGTVLFDDSTTHDDQVSAARPLGFTGQFFGLSETTVAVSTNGNFNFVGDAAYNNTTMPSGTARINPLWDDLFITQGAGGSIVEKTSPGVYSVTWQSMEIFPGSVPRQTFQAAWFGAPTTIGGFAFQPDDIAFSYNNVDAGFRNGDATVGLDKGAGGIFDPLPGDADGLISDAQNNLLPLGAGDFILFRPDGSGSYNSSLESLSAIPEPSTWAWGLSLLGAVAFPRVRRRSASQVGM